MSNLIVAPVASRSLFRLPFHVQCPLTNLRDTILSHRKHQSTTISHCSDFSSPCNFLSSRTHPSITCGNDLLIETATDVIKHTLSYCFKVIVKQTVYFNHISIPPKILSPERTKPERNIQSIHCYTLFGIPNSSNAFAKIH